jgi:hypothetical protein
MDALHKIDTKTPPANVDVDFAEKSRPRANLHPRIFAELSTVTPAAQLVGAGEVVEVKRIEIASQLKYTFPREFREATDCRRFRVFAEGDTLVFYCLE